MDLKTVTLLAAALGAFSLAVSIIRYTQYALYAAGSFLSAMDALVMGSNFLARAALVVFLFALYKKQASSD